MKKKMSGIIQCTLIALLSMIPLTVYSQDKPPLEAVTDRSTVSFSKETPLSIVLRALNELSVRLDRIVIIDPEQETSSIDVEIENETWKEALASIADFHEFDLIENENYIQLNRAAPPVQIQQSASELVQQGTGLKPVTKDLREITIEATFIEADRQMLKEFGINWNVLSSRGNTTVIAGQNVVGNPAPEDVGTFELTRSSGSTEFHTLIKALESNDAGKIIANPRITVTDGRTGRVQIGQDFSIKQRDFSGNVIDKFVSSGIILSVTPNIIVEDTLYFIHLGTQVERSSVSPGTISTIINKTQAQTELLLNDHEEVGIGGLYLTQDDVTRTGIPILKDIPKWFFGLGYIFGYNKISSVEKELVILLKAEIVPTLEERLVAMRMDRENN